jgi:HAD superfamily hydrolase (TIGR01509 family)
MLKALIFDVDGTLAETEEYHRRAFNRTFFEAGLDWHWDEALYRDLLKVTGGKERITHFMAQHAPEVQADAAMLAPRLHIRKTAIYLEFMAQEGIPLRAGMADLIKDARAAGLALAIATTTNLPNVEGLLSKAIGPAWRDVFPVVIAGDMVAAKKPAPDVYLAALAELALPAKACLALEDSANGVASARAAGLDVVGFRSPYLPFDDLSQAVQVFEPPQTPTLALVEAAVQRIGFAAH